MFFRLSVSVSVSVYARGNTAIWHLEKKALIKKKLLLSFSLFVFKVT